MKGIAVTQIILLVLGVMVLAVVAYLLYTNFILTGGQIGLEQCRTQITSLCTACKLKYGGSIPDGTMTGENAPCDPIPSRCPSDLSSIGLGSNRNPGVDKLSKEDCKNVGIE